MPLILAIEPDSRQASRLTALAKSPLRAELLVAESTAKAFAALGTRTPDLILTSLLLSPKDENELADRLRELDAAGSQVQTLVIPVLGTAARRSRQASRGLLTRLRRSKSPSEVSDGCDPAMFAAQITEYLGIENHIRINGISPALWCRCRHRQQFRKFAFDLVSQPVDGDEAAPV
jgi:CheY-like chemotaxis protein